MRFKQAILPILAIICVMLDPIVFCSGQQGRRGGSGAPVFKTQIAPHWFDDDRHFWYRNELANGETEYILVDVEKGLRTPAFDHARLATELRDNGLADADANRLALADLDFLLVERKMRFQTDGTGWVYHLDEFELERIERQQAEESPNNFLPNIRVTRASTRRGDETEIVFENRLLERVDLYWVDTQGERQRYGSLDPGERFAQHTFALHYWEVLNSDGERVAAFQADTSDRIAVIGEVNPPATSEESGGTRRGETRRGGTQREGFRRGLTNPSESRPLSSPDGNASAFIRDGNVFLTRGNAEGERQISRDGNASIGYGMMQWSPSGASLLAFRIEPGDIGDVHLIESSPDGGGRAKLQTRSYALPGDRFTSYQLCLFGSDQDEMEDVDVDPIEFGRPRLRWSEDGRHFTYQHTDRGHQRFRLVEVDSHTGKARTLIDEKSETFIWTAHFQSRSLPKVNWLEQTNELIFTSEKSGWRQLYLLDSSADEPKLNPITQGRFVVRGIDRIDEDKRQIWFTASGFYPDQDPYFIHYFRIDFDGSNLTPLTAANGTHSVQFSPTGELLIATYSRIDQAPAHELRRVDDGELICHLETADVSLLENQGWQPPEVFVAKGRDGVTDIWGIICRPADFDPTKSYPVIEDIYAGPHDSFVPKSFSTRRYYESLTRLGFIVVKIDGMGTANRSKAFHDVCWQNLKDAGLPDRILWHQAVHGQYEYYDTDRVGIYGTSAGGQNSTGAVLFHPDFYKVAVSACGCHDNRMDKASWNEQWMGYPVGPQYAASSNIDNAYRLQGKLLLIVGEMDTNVPPESTMRLVDALINANKDFDLLVVPGGGHGMGGRYGQRRMHDFFVRHLLGEEPPDRNRTSD